MEPQVQDVPYFCEHKYFRAVCLQFNFCDKIHLYSLPIQIVHHVRLHSVLVFVFCFSVEQTMM